MEDYRETTEGKRRFDNPELYEKTLAFQTQMAENGIAWHNHFSDECTIDFCCCNGDNLKEFKGSGGKIYPETKYKHYIPSFTTVIKQAFTEYYETVKSTDKDGKIKKSIDRFVADNY